MHVRIGHKINKHFKGQVLSLRPIVVTGSPVSPVSWICGHASVPEGMQAVGEDRTTVDDRSCRPCAGPSVSPRRSAGIARDL